MSDQGKTQVLGSGQGGPIEKAGWDAGRRITGANLGAGLHLEGGRITLNEVAHVGMPAKLDLTGYITHDLALGTLLNTLIDRCTELSKALIYAEHMRR